jgi:hypothetical protein
MTDDWRPENIRATLDQLSQTIRDAESVRAHVERTLRKPAFWPERRAPRHWRNGDVMRPEERQTGQD